MFASWAVRALIRRPSLHLKSPRRQLLTVRRSMATAHTLDYDQGPLVWIDCEMTGLDPRRDRLLEIAVRCGVLVIREGLIDRAM